MQADLHIHSTVSDGSMEPMEILRLASGQGLDAVAITDHDTDAAHQILKASEEKIPIAVIPGLELDTRLGGIIVEILVYGHTPGSGPLAELLGKIEERRRKRAEIIWISVRRGLGTELPPLNFLYPAPRKTVTRPQMANCLLESGLAPHMEGAMEIVTAYDPGFDPPDVSEALAVVKASGGLSVLAHPLHYQDVNLSGLIEELIPLGLSGIESCYPYEQDEDIARCAEVEALAKDHQLFMTGGSDAHRPEDIGRCTVKLPSSLKEFVSSP